MPRVRTPDLAVNARDGTRPRVRHCVSDECRLRAPPARGRPGAPAGAPKPARRGQKLDAERGSVSRRRFHL
jgi:hypothetical protein